MNRLKGLRADAPSRLSNLDTIRLCLATIVIFHHSFDLWKGMPQNPFAKYSAGQINLGVVAVGFFFAISGYLISQSRERSSSVWSYLKKRILRIYPAYIVAFLLSITVVGYLGAAHPGTYYQDLLHGIGWKELLHRMMLLQLPLTPETMVGLELPNAVNGSLWTIPFEAVCYLVVAVFWSKEFLQDWRFVLGLLLLSLLGMYRYEGGYVWGLGSLLMAFFSAGALCYVLREKVKYTNLLFLVSIAVLLLSIPTGFFRLALPTVGVFALFAGFSQTVRLPSFGKGRDFSYGMYVYAFPIQQLLLFFYTDWLKSPYWLFLASTLATFLVAVVSWYIIEKPALSLKSWAPRKRRVIEPILDEPVILPEPQTVVQTP